MPRQQERVARTLCIRTQSAPTYLFSDPWWIFTTINLFWNVKSRYDFQVLEILRISPRFVVLLSAMCLSIVFLLLDILSVTSILRSVLPTGINPFWKVSKANQLAASPRRIIPCSLTPVVDFSELRVRELLIALPRGDV